MANDIDEPKVFELTGRAFSNSRDVAAYFNKDHKTVLRTVRNILARRPDLNRRNFALVEHPDEKGEMRPTYDMDRDGFTLLAMGFTGDEALEFKLRYIEAFNRMEAALKDGAALPSPDAPEPRPYQERTHAEITADCRAIDLYERMYPGSPEVIRWAAGLRGWPTPPKEILDRSRQGRLFSDGEG